MRLEERQVIEAILADTASYYHRNLNGEARHYLIETRGFTEETIERFRIGYSNGGLRDYLINEIGRPEELCLMSGVLKRNESGEIRDHFYSRIIFPNIRRGHVVHLTGREFSGGGGPKYLHLAGEISYLFNEDALADEVVYITEGPTDCITAVQNGLPAVAVLGATSFKQEFAPRFSRCEKVYVCLDGDPAGEAGASRIGEFMPDRSYIVQLPPGVDLDEYLRGHSREEFQQLVASSKRFLQHKLEQIPQNTERTELPRRLEPILRVLSRMNEALAEHFLNNDLRIWFSFRSEEVDAYRRLLRGRRQSERRERGSRNTQGSQEASYLAKFDGLIDLAEQNGAVAYLVKEGNAILVKDHVDLDGVRYVPPPKAKVP